MDEKYNFPDKMKMASFALMGIGLLSLIIGFIVSPNRTWADLLVNNIFFLGIALCGVFFIAANYLANAGWYVAIKRIPEAMISYIPIPAVIMILIGVGAGTHLHHIYHWADSKAVAADELLQGKEPYLNITWFMIRMAIYFAGWLGFAFILRKLSRQEDIAPDTKYYKQSLIYSAAFIVFFAVTSSMCSWDWIMSIDAHWYSTLFGWYMFASMFVSSLTAMALIVVILKRQGYLPKVNFGHIHDLGKYVFAFSIFWTYLWFSQFILIWYANIPEETIYYVHRLEHYKFWFFFTPFLNFLMPFLILMTRNAKRNYNTLIFVGGVVLFGHWLDFYLMIYPGVAGHHDHWNPGLLELGTLLGFIGAFAFVVFTALTKANLMPKNHPYLEESLHHQT